MAKKNPLGPVGEQLRDNIRRLREERGFSYQRLSELLAELGRPIPTLGLSRLERGERRVDADDLVALAKALGTDIVQLLGLGCPACLDRPPSGFSCRTCGTDG